MQLMPNSYSAKVMAFDLCIHLDLIISRPARGMLACGEQLCPEDREFSTQAK
jgi:hypothetical protein